MSTTDPAQPGQDPTSDPQQGATPPAGPPNPYGAPQYGTPQQPPPAYPAPSYPAPPYGAPQAPVPGQPAYGQPAYGYPPQAALPSHPSATTALVLSLVGLVGIALCGGITLVLSPFAWRIGARAVREIDAAPGQYGGRDQANAGRIMGIIGTVLLVVGIVVIIGLLGLVVAGTGTTFSTTSYSNG
ncbi:MAG: DUF4190 domain-containing protein [Nocardioides sp.]